MRHALPVIIADGENRKQRLQPDHPGRKQPRRQRRSRLARGQAQTRRAGAKLLGGHRPTSGPGLARYATGGVAAWLARQGPAGQPVSRPPDVLAGLEQALRPPAGLAAYEAVRQWGEHHDHRAGKSHTRSTLVRPRVNATLQGPRPSPTQTP